MQPPAWSNPRTFGAPQKGNRHLAVRAPSPWHPRICSQSLWTCLSRIFHVNGITQHVALSVLLLSLSIVFLSCIHTVGCYQAFHSFHTWTLFHCIAHCMDGPHVVYSLLSADANMPISKRKRFGHSKQPEAFPGCQQDRVRE